MAKSSKSKKTSKAKAPPASFDKYAYYLNSVQAPDNDVLFLRDTYKELRGKAPEVLREDFCGTFSICCEWAKMGPKFRAHGIDLDYEPIQYGLANYLPKLSSSQQGRVQVHQENVLNPGLPRADIICAMNFSHFIFKERAMMKSYFHNCYATLNPGGIMVADCFGGSACFEPNTDATPMKNFTYYWQEESFDPVTNNAVFNIHYKPKGQKKIEKVFTYDWRMWSIPEIRDMMLETGFRKTHVYWEGTTKKGEGDGNFKQVEKGEECQAWIAYIVGEK
jgi:hypothetical protein